jgi:hypothetical protein
MAGPTEDTNKTSTKNPIVVDLGKKRRKLVKELRRGSGKLMDDVQDTLQELRSAGSVAANAQPVIVIVRERSRSRGKLWSL